MRRNTLTVAQSACRIIEGDHLGIGEPSIMESIKELADAIYRERVLRARRTPIELKIEAGGELFEGVCQRMTDGLRDENPGADEATIQDLLRRRLALLRRLEYPAR
jgi:hypothetical protein